VAGGEQEVRGAAELRAAAWEERLRWDRGQTFHDGEEVEERQEWQGPIGTAEWTCLVYVCARLVDSYQEDEPWEQKE
jgi:hypothetical protein